MWTDLKTFSKNASDLFISKILFKLMSRPYKSLSSIIYADLQRFTPFSRAKSSRSFRLWRWTVQELKALMGTMWSPSRLNTTRPSAESKREKEKPLEAAVSMKGQEVPDHRLRFGTWAHKHSMCWATASYQIRVKHIQLELVVAVCWRTYPMMDGTPL